MTLPCANCWEIWRKQSVGTTPKLIPSNRKISLQGPAKWKDCRANRVFALQVIQPGLAGLMDGSVSTLAPVFAAAFATKDSWDAFLVGMAASIGAGISMGFAEALSDDGSLTGRGRPWIRVAPFAES